jgi:hypothetical protein
MTILKPITALAIGAAFCCAICGPAGAAERPGQLKLEAKISSRGSMQDGQKRSSWSGTEEFTLSATMLSSGLPDPQNRIDLEGNAAAAQQQMKQAQSRMPSPEQQKATMERARSAMESCKGNVACLTQAAQQLSAATSSWNMRPADTSADSGRFYSYNPPMPAQCNGDFHGQIKRASEGSFADVQGHVPFTLNTSADYRATPLEKQGLCVQIGLIVLDTRDSKVFVHALPLEVTGRIVRTEGQRVMTDDAQSRIRFNEEAMKWISNKLRSGVARSGKEHVILPALAAGGATVKGSIEVDLSWQFSDN